MRTADLTGPLLDYWTARAEGVPAAELEIRPVQRPDPRTPDAICVRKLGAPGGRTVGVIVLDYSTNWALTGPLIAKYHPTVESNMSDQWSVCIFNGRIIQWLRDTGPTPLIAICRAVVRAAFGEEVEEAAPCA